MRILILFFMTLLTKQGFCGDDRKQPNQNYAIISDQKCSDVPPNKCRIVGVVLFEGSPVSNALISTFPKTVSTKTDSLGKFGLMVGATDSVLYFYDPRYGEIVMDSYHFSNGHEVVLAFYVANAWEFPEQDKPVIYLSSPGPISATIQLKFKGELLFSYPTYEKGWNVRVNGDEIYDQTTNRTYSYLFWEGRDPALDFAYSEDQFLGFVLKTDTIVPFLETKLDFLGLNFRERTDFITYWAPRIMEHNYIIAQFLIDDQYHQLIAEIVIDPNPDAMRRIFLLYKGFEERPTLDVHPQVLKPFSRQGFTLIEWGGSDLTKFSKL